MSSHCEIQVLVRLPFIIRCWRYWCHHGLRRNDGTVIAGSFIHRAIAKIAAFTDQRLINSARVDISVDKQSETLFLDALDLRTYQKVLPELESESKEIRLARALMTERTTFIDVGANIGVMSVAALLGGAYRVISFEPNPTLAPYLRRSGKTLRDQGRWIIEEIGLGSKKASTKLYVDRFFSGTGSMHCHWQGTLGEAVPVSIDTLDGWIADNNSEFDSDTQLVIKMDVEGWENEVITGARSTIFSHQPYLWFELNQPSLDTLNNQPPLPTESIYKLGYRCAVDIEALPNLQHIDLTRKNPPHRRMNILAIPEARRKDFEQRVRVRFNRCDVSAGSPTSP